MADCGIAAWDMIETMQGPCLPAQRPAHYQPHHHFDALAAGFTQIFDMRNVAQGIAFADKAIEEHIVPFAVDQAGAWTLDLVAHAPVPQICTLRSSGKLSTARLIAS